MEWSYGVTTVPERFDTTLPKTLKSLAEAGFDSPRLFIDGECTIPESLSKYQITQRTPRIRSFGNWYLALLELYIRNPGADRYAIFQDDLTCVKNLREYLERASYPEKCYLNLYLFAENERLAVGRTGFFQANQKGKGAVALIFNQSVVRALLTSPHFVERVQDARRGWKAIDGGVVSAANKAGIKEYCHMPSLVQHTGRESSMGNRRHALARSFPGESADALQYLTKGARPAAPKPSPVPLGRGGRIGLVGYNCGGEDTDLARLLAEHVEIDSWLVRPHSTCGLGPMHAAVDNTVCRNGAKVPGWLKTVDVVVFVEDYAFPNLASLAKRMGVWSACILRPGRENASMLARHVDLFIATSESSRGVVVGRPHLYFPWPEVGDWEHAGAVLTKVLRGELRDQGELDAALIPPPAPILEMATQPPD